MNKSRRRHHIKLSRRFILFVGAMLIFVVSIVYYFMNTFMVTEREYAVYSSIEEPTLPVISAVVDGRDINLMPGYRQDLGNAVLNDCVTPIPEDRHLRLHIQCYETQALEMSYEIRSLDTEHFIERTTVTEFENEGDGEITAVLPIQNMIARDTQYLLNFKMDMGEEIINYYTRIVWPSNDDIYQMISLAADFSEKSFDSEAARDLTIYLETDEAADTSSYGTVNINSGFSQITWGSTGMELSGDLRIKLKACDGIMAAIEVSYFSEIPISSDLNLNPDVYYNTDEFTMRMGSERVYIMNFQRKTNQVFNGNKHFFSGLRINLGITNDEALQAVKSENLRYVAFKSSRELWLYDQTDKEAVNVFSFRSETDTLRADNDDYDVKILSLSDDGILDYVVYGYINRGRHEGYNGIIYYRYDTGTKSVSELFFMPLVNSFENIKQELGELCIKNNAGLFYFKQNEAVVAIDLNSLEMVNVVDDLTENRYDISNDQTEIAWIDGGTYEPNSIRLMNIMTGQTDTITENSSEILSVVSFFGTDLIYGISQITDEAIANGRTVSMPMQRLKIISPDTTPVMEYEKTGLYLDNIEIEGDRIHVGQYKKDEETGEYRFSSRDTIVNTEAEQDTQESIILTDNDETRKRIYYVQLDENIRTTRALSVEAPESISYQDSGTVELSQNTFSDVNRYFAFSNGSLQGIRYTLQDAMNIIYDDMGWIVDENGSIVYARADRASSWNVNEPFNQAQPIIMTAARGFDSDTVTSDGYIVMDAYGIELDRLLYYVYKDCPILAFLDEDDYCLIYGYNSTGVEIYHPSLDETSESEATTETMLYEDAAMYFDLTHNNFIVFTRYQASS